MPRLRRLTSREVLKILSDLGFVIAQIRGSHAKLIRVPSSGERQVLTVPLHPEIASGTVRANYRQATRFVPAADLRKGFFSE